MNITYETNIAYMENCRAYIEWPGFPVPLQLSEKQRTLVVLLLHDPTQSICLEKSLSCNCIFSLSLTLLPMPRSFFLLLCRYIKRKERAPSPSLALYPVPPPCVSVGAAANVAIPEPVGTHQ